MRTTGIGILGTMNTSDARLYVDVGQTGSRVQDIRGLRHSTNEGFTPATRIESLLEDILGQIEHRSAGCVVLSLTGLGGQVPELGEIASVCSRLTGCSSLGVCDDGLAWSVGSLAGGDGVALAVGGGVVSVARSGDNFCHADGNGSDFGDSGGAYWLGRKGIRVAIRAIEGSDTATSLSDSFLRTLGPHDEFVRTHRAQHDVHRVCIAFAAAVLDAACDGDKTALDILQIGSTSLAALVVASASVAELSQLGTRVALGGGLMRNEVYRGLVESAISSGENRFEVIHPLGDAIDGLIYLEQGGRTDMGSLMRWWSA